MQRRREQAKAAKQRYLDKRGPEYKQLQQAYQQKEDVRAKEQDRL